MSDCALAALILITCHGRRGEWVSLHRLISRLMAPGHRIEEVAEKLVAANKLAYATYAGHPYWGVGVEGVLPVPSTTQPTTENP
jgi:hypothetical protein